MNTDLERIRNDIENLARFTSTPGKGLTRLSFSTEDRDAREYIKSKMREAGLEVYEDAAGTVVGRLEGEYKDGPVIMLGSHFDSVKSGGNFDGPAGVVTALEIARVFREKGYKPKYPVEFIGMIEEEGCRFGGGLLGSRGMAGQVTREELDRFKDDSGVSVAEAMKEFGFDPDKIKEAVRKQGSIKAFIELHIEQGPILETKGKDIGIVEYIVGIREFEVVIKGRPDHAGTTPMDMRADALVAAADVITKIPCYAKEAGEGTVATVGKMQVFPGAANIVPGEVRFIIDLRSKKGELIDEVAVKIDQDLKRVTEEKGVVYSLIENLSVPPVKLAPQIIDRLTKSCDSFGFTRETMLSGAGHDAMIMADITEVGMVFVPSKGGRSHCPEEWTDYEQLQKGIEVVYNTVKELAEIK